MIGIRINVQDTATPALRRLEAGIQPARLAPIIGRSARNATREHLFARDAQGNKLGGRRTHYYGQAARATNFTVEGDMVVVSIPQIGIRQRYYGGTIKPKTAKYLTIPVHPAAHGKRAREFGDLQFAIKPGIGPCLVRPGGMKATRTKVQQRGRFRGEDSTSSVLSTSYGADVVMYRLVRSVTQQADPSVLPTSEALAAAIRPDLEAHIARLTARASGPA